ncbi:MAG TPA: hypothetical protein H9742_01910 [Candidatus Acetatifactor stercoripullorum]|uniref:YopX protein domain-containing protein n=1 Tax=Candidatus Acetatifactor stercoripullorum TaxID=2838414 RepID=A0A9D1R4E0_9FIRM|nr:YopX family protein [uncultured Acetatifactor sp.]HIW80273.1 hypothetical protein [Candidatus Acetatifactor stercoripullorum]
MKARAKSSNTPYPIWVYGEYITNPPMRPSDGAKRPEGHYIDKGGYPGANVYAINLDTFCRQTAAVDKNGNKVYIQDILLHETEEEIAYFIVEDEETAIDIVWGEIVETESLQTADIKVIGNTIDNPDFVKGMQYYRDNDIEIPYLPLLNTQMSEFPYLQLECTKCHNVMLSCVYMAQHKECGGFLKAGFATKVYREKEKAFA